MKDFECTKCGECCRRIRGIPGLEDFVTESGACVNLADDNSCKIYETRPKICRINDMYDLVSEIMSLGQWHTLNQKACKMLQDSSHA
jgi:Fe-S-cluster containining protein